MTTTTSNSKAINRKDLEHAIKAIGEMITSGEANQKIEKMISDKWGGEAYRFHRQAVMLELTGQRLGVAACGVKALAKRFMEKYQPTTEVSAEANTDVIATEKVETVVTPTPKKVKAQKVEKVEAATTTDAVEKPKASKGIKLFDRPTDIPGQKIAYRADLTERMAAIETPQEFEKFFAELPTTCGLVSRIVPYFTRNWTLRIVSADEKTKFSLNKVIEKFEVHLNGVKNEDMTTDFRALTSINAVMNTTKLQGVTITDGKKTLTFGEGTKYGVELICDVASRTRLKTLATDFAIVELVV